jgi:hypothetical protein
MASRNEASIWVSSAPWPRETRHEAGAARQASSVLLFLRLVLRPRLLPQELRRYDAQRAKLRPLVLAKMARPVSNRLPESLLFRARYTEDLMRYHRKRCAPNRRKWILSLANIQNCDELTVQLIPMPSGRLPRDYAQR